MPGSVVLEIAGITVRLDGDDAVLDDLRGPLGAFLARGTTASAAFTVERLPGEAEPANLELPKLAETAGAWRLEQADLFSLEMAAPTPAEPTPGAATPPGTIRFRRCRPDQVEGLRPVGVRGALVALWSLLLPQRGGFLLHAAGARVGDRAVAFVGESGAGKSTLAATLPPDDVLSDELVAARPTEEGWLLYSTPFHGALRAPRRAQRCRWGAGFALAQAAHTRCAPLGRAEALRLALACTAIVGGSAACEGLAFGAAAAAVAAVEWLTLEFPRDGRGVVDAVRRVLAPQR